MDIVDIIFRLLISYPLISAVIFVVLGSLLADNGNGYYKHNEEHNYYANFLFNSGMVCFVISAIFFIIYFIQQTADKG